MTATYILSADIGASKTRVRLSSMSKRRVSRSVAQLETESGTESHLKLTIRNFVVDNLKDRKAHILGAVIGLPGKISSDRQSCAITYLNPDKYINFEDLFDELNVENGILLNDLECGSYGVPLMSNRELLLMGGSSSDQKQIFDRFVLGMPGSGFGLGIRLGIDSVVTSEGGNIAAAINPSDETELEIWSHLIANANSKKGKRGPITYNHLICGHGIPNIFQTLVENHKENTLVESVLSKLNCVAESERPLAIEKWAFSENHICRPFARDTFLYYGRFFGRAMQTVTLIVMPEIIYLGGNITIATHALFRNGFIESFQTHDAHGSYLRQVPIYVVLCPSLNLEGATHKATLIAS